MNQEPEQLGGQTLDWVLGPKIYRVLISLPTGQTYRTKRMYLFEAKSLHKKFDKDKANGNEIKIGDQTIDPHFVAHVGIVKDQQSRLSQNQHMVSITIDKATKRIDLLTSEKNIDDLITLLSEGVVWALRAGQMHGDTFDDTAKRIQQIGNKLITGIQEISNKNIEEHRL